MDESYALTGEDIKHFFNGKIKIVPFREIANYDTLEELLAPWGRIMILFEKKRGYGHWCSLFYGEGPQAHEIFFFDPYAMAPESELKYSEGKNRYLKQRRNTLIRLFKDKIIKYNPVQLQAWKDKIKTCGRWNLARISCNNLDSYQFANLIKSQTDDPDKFITKMTNLFLE